MSYLPPDSVLAENEDIARLDPTDVTHFRAYKRGVLVLINYGTHPPPIAGPEGLTTTIRGRTGKTTCTPTGEGEVVTLWWSERDDVHMFITTHGHPVDESRRIAEGLEELPGGVATGDAIPITPVVVSGERADREPVTRVKWPGNDRLCVDVSGPHGGWGDCFPLPRPEPVSYVLRSAYPAGPVPKETDKVSVELRDGRVIAGHVFFIAGYMATGFFVADMADTEEVAAVVAYDSEGRELGRATAPASDLPDRSPPRHPPTPASPPTPGG